MSEHVSLRVICSDDMNTVQCAVFRIGTLTGDSCAGTVVPCPVQVKDPYTDYILMHVSSSCKHSVMYNVRRLFVLQIIRFAHHFPGSQNDNNVHVGIDLIQSFSIVVIKAEPNAYSYPTLITNFIRNTYAAMMTSSVIFSRKIPPVSTVP